MSWIKASKALPERDAEVLVRCRTIVSVAVYRKTLKKFMLLNGSFYEPGEKALEWLSLIPTKSFLK